MPTRNDYFSLKKLVWSFLVLVYLAGEGSMAAAQETIKVESRKRSWKMFLTPDRKFFNYDHSYTGNKASEIDRLIKHLPRYTDRIKLFLNNDNNTRPGLELLLPVWGGLYCNLPKLTGRPDAVDAESPIYVLSLLFCARYQEAEERAHAILKKEPDNYGALLLLGILAVYDQNNLPYLERALVMNPYKTVWIFDWHLSKFQIKPKKEWDFVHAYFLMLAKHRNLFIDLKFPDYTAFRLYTGIKNKYEDPKNPFLDYEQIKPDMDQLRDIIRVNFSTKELIPREVIERNETITTIEIIGNPPETRSTTIIRGSRKPAQE